MWILIELQGTGMLSSEDEFVTAKVDTFDSKVASFISHKAVLQFSQVTSGVFVRRSLAVFVILNGYNLSTPKTKKFSKDCENGCVRYGLLFMQGWRTTMEDAMIKAGTLKFRSNAQAYY
ncbi:hypothetical protein DVH24_001512 [Malus domestica]|uniref:Uncharacterized protein n=1 Tax=Malus domestica TaxID=3750 RepID=A0A498K1U1_MALDO|nr:hypothetical protein DVH24_001512 [Malus domestica]